MTDADPSSGTFDRLRRRAMTALSAARDRLSVAERLVEREVLSGTSVTVPWRQRLSLWRRGFNSRSGVLFAADERGYDDLMSDYHLERLGDLGGHWGEVVDNKLASRLLLGSFEDRLPAFYGVIDGGVLRRRLPFVSTLPGTDTTSGRSEAGPWVLRALEATGALVLKPIYGHGGRGVTVCRRLDDGGYEVDGRRTTESELLALVEDLEEYGVWELIEQAGYAEALFPDSVNTLRVLTLRDEDGAPFVSGAVHRIGTAESAPVDNWSRGGLSAELRPDGTLGRAAQWDEAAGEVRRHVTHPDTGERIEGTTVPGWSEVREDVLAMAEELPYLPRIGWDVVVTDDGFLVLELNTHPGIETLQVHRPRLEDPKTRRFYERHGHR